MTDSTKKKGKLPKDVSKLTGDELMQKVFNKKVAEELKKVAHEKDDEEPKDQ